MSNLTIFKTSIRKFNDLYSLNDLHIASGSNKNHQPAFFIRNSQTQELIAEIERSANSQIAVKTVRGGRNPELQGTWACEELALAYATWISPKFHLVVLRAFIAMHKGQHQPQQIALPEPEETFTFELKVQEAKDFAWALFATAQMHSLLGQLEPALAAIGSNFHPMVYSYHQEYAYQLKPALRAMKKFIQPFKDRNEIDWQRLSRNLEKLEIEQLRANANKLPKPF